MNHLEKPLNPISLREITTNGIHKLPFLFRGQCYYPKKEGKTPPPHRIFRPIDMGRKEFYVFDGSFYSVTDSDDVEIVCFTDKLEVQHSFELTGDDGETLIVELVSGDLIKRSQENLTAYLSLFIEIAVFYRHGLSLQDFGTESTRKMKGKFIPCLKILVAEWFITSILKYNEKFKGLKGAFLFYDFWKLWSHFSDYLTDDAHCSRTFEVSELQGKLELISMRKKIAGQKEHLANLKSSSQLSRRNNNLGSNVEDLIKDAEQRITILEQKLAASQITNTTPCMMEETPNEVTVETTHFRNTAVATASEEYEASVTNAPPKMDFVQEVMADITHEFMDYTSREERFFSYRLDRSITRGQILAEIHLPHDFLVAKWQTPNALPFRNHCYFVGGMELRFQWNLAKTQQLKVQMGVVYHLLQRDRYAELQQAGPISQQPGGSLNGHMKNSTIINVDYWSYQPIIPTRVQTTSMPLYVATVTIQALTPFEFGDGDTESAELIGYMRFKEGTRFFAQELTNNTIPVPLSIPIANTEPCMMAAVAAIGSGIASDLLGTVKGVAAGAAGTLIGAANTVVRKTVNTATSKLVRGIESEIAMPLQGKRSNRDKATSHENHALHQRTTTNIASGSGLFEADSYRLETTATATHPEFLVGSEQFNTIDDLISIFGFNNSFRFNKTHTQGTMIGYHSVGPQATLSNGQYATNGFLTPVDHMSAWFRSYHGNLEFRYEAITDGFKTARLRFVWIPEYKFVTYEESDAYPFRIFDIGPDLQTQLIWCQESPFIYNFNNAPITLDNGSPFVAGIMLIFVETAISAPVGTSAGMDILLYKRAAPGFKYTVPGPNMTAFFKDGVGPQPPFPPVEGYTRNDLLFASTLTAGIPTLQIATTTTVLVTIPIPIAGTTTNMTGPTTVRAVNGPASWTFADGPLSIAITRFGNDGAARVELNMRGGNIVLFTVGTLFAPSRIELETTGSGWVAIALAVVDTAPCMDSRFDNPGSETFTGSPIAFDEGLHGESHMDLMTNLRRFEHFDNFVLRCPETPTEKICVHRMLLNFGASSVRNEQNQLQSRSKIVHLHDAFRFARGGTRYLVTVSGDHRNGVLFFQHKPLVNNPALTRAQQSAQLDYDENGYGELVMSLQQNNVMAHEIPNYNIGNATLNSSYLSDKFSTNICSNLGELRFYWFGRQTELYVDVKRAWADDTKMYCFNGFPQRRTLYAPGTPFAFVDAEFQPPVSTEPCMISIVPENTIKKMDTALDGVNDLTSQIKDFISDLAKSGKPMECLSTIAIQIGQVINNPTLTTLALSTAQILVTLRIVSFESLSKIQALISSCYTDWTSNRPCQIDEDMEEVTEFSGVLFSGVGLLMGTKDAKKGRFENFVANFGKSSASHSRVLEFIRSLLNYLKKAALFICKKWFPESRLYHYLSGGAKEKMITWCRRVQIVTDPTLYTRIESSPKYAGLIYHLINEGDEFAVQLVASDRNTKIGQLLTSSLVSLKKVRDKLARKLNIPRAKYDPYAYWIGGRPGTGKSVLLEKISYHLAKEVFNLRSETEPIYVAPEDPYWTNYTSQPIIHFDDFERCNHVDPVDSDTLKFCGIKGNTPYVIPKAFEDKGTLCVAKLVGIASNYLYPEAVKGIAPQVVWRRRDIMWEYVPNFNNFLVCGACPTFTLPCSECRGLNEEALKGTGHIRFRRKHPTSDGAKFGRFLNWEDFLTFMTRHAKEYHEKEMVEHQNRINKTSHLSDEAYRRRANGEEEKGETEAFVTPNKPFTDLKNVMSDELAEHIINELGGFISTVPSFNIREYFFGKKREEVVVDNCLHEVVDNGMEFEFLDDGSIYWPHLFANGKVLTSSPCGEYCLWPERQESFIAHWCASADYDDAKPNLPQRYNTGYLHNVVHETLDSYLASMKRKGWLDSFLNLEWSLTTTIGVFSVALGALGLLAYTVTKGPSLEFELPEPTTSMFDLTEDELQDQIIAVSNRNATNISIDNAKYNSLPCLMSSDDVKTHFSPIRARVHARLPIKNLPATTTPCNNTMEELKQVYIRSTLTVEMDGCKLAIFVSLAPGVYVTQFHAMAAIVMRMTRKLEHLKKSFAEHNPGIEPNYERDFKDSLSLECWKTTAKGQVIMERIAWRTLVEQNVGRFQLMFEGGDLCIFKLHIQNFTTDNLARFLVTEKHENYVRQGQKKVYHCSKGEIHDNTVKYIEEFNSYNRYDEKFCSAFLSKPVEGGLTMRLDGYRCSNPYSVYNNKCGSILCDPVTNKVIGIMSNANKQTCYFNALSHAQLREAGMLENWKDKNQNMILLAECTTPAMEAIPVPSENKLITIPPMHIYQTTKSAIVKSKCFESFGKVKRAPAILSTDGDRGVRAIISGLAHYTPHKPFPERHMKNAERDIARMFKANAIPILEVESERNLRTAVQGIPEHIPRLKMSTSPGMPWTTNAETSRKSDLLEFDENHQLIKIHKDLDEMIRVEEDMMSKGIVPFTVHQISLKDERLKLDKLTNVRLIQGSPLSSTISTRKFFMDFNYAFQVNRFSLQHAVGIDPYGPEWDRIAQTLLLKSNNICVGDYSKFGPRLLTEFVEASYRIMNEWYAQYDPSERDQLIRTILGHRVMNCWNIAENQLFKLECGSPSGAINTVIVNSICNMMYIRCAWQGVMEERCPTESDLSSFEENVEFFCYGDDVIFAVSDSMIEHFNNETIGEYFSKFDVKYTDVTKDGRIRKFCSLEEASFLKNGFFLYENSTRPFWIPRPDIDDILDTTNWVRKPKGLPNTLDLDSIYAEATFVNCRDALRRMWFWGRDAFEKFQQELDLFWSTYTVNGKRWKTPDFSFEALQLKYGYPLKKVDIYVSNIDKTEQQLLAERKTMQEMYGVQTIEDLWTFPEAKQQLKVIEVATQEGVPSLGPLSCFRRNAPKNLG